jgi:hypothetical protein
MLAGKVRVNPSESPFGCSALVYAPGLAHKQKARVERLARSTQSSLLQKFVTYDCKKFNNTDDRQQCSKKILWPLVTKFLECSSLAHLSRIVYCLWVRPGANLTVENLKSASFW